MIIKYKDYIKENLTNTEHQLLDFYKITEYSLNKKTNLIDVDQDVNLFDITARVLPNIRFGTIEGDFSCHSNGLTSLKGCPREVYGDFSCQSNSLTSLEGCPEIVDGNFDCADNLLTSLEFSPLEIPHGQYHCSRNKLTSLEYLPNWINMHFFCDNNPLTIEDYPIKSKIKFMCKTYSFDVIDEIVKDHKEVFDLISDDKIKFHQMVMRINPRLIPEYKTIPVPKNKSSLLL